MTCKVVTWHEVEVCASCKEAVENPTAAVDSGQPEPLGLIPELRDASWMFTLTGEVYSKLACQGCGSGEGLRFFAMVARNAHSKIGYY